jgi:SAM-dependent methyltransferase
MISRVSMPRRLQFAIRHFGLDQLAVLDVGCGPGTYLAHFGPGSLGLDIDPDEAASRGLPVLQCDLTEGLPPEVGGRFDAVWASSIIEHVPSPHELLIGLRAAFHPDSERLLLAVVPNTTWFTNAVWHVVLKTNGHLAGDHVGFFTPRTIRHTIERAGYEVEAVVSPAIPSLPVGLASRLATIAPVLVAAARCSPSWQYPNKSHKRLVDGRIESKVKQE